MPFLFVVVVIVPFESNGISLCNVSLSCPFYNKFKNKKMSQNEVPSQKK
jgi:hypothetical protein